MHAAGVLSIKYKNALFFGRGGLFWGFFQLSFTKFHHLILNLLVIYPSVMVDIACMSMKPGYLHVKSVLRICS